MKAKIENPKVFISYARGNNEYQNKVNSFVNSLRDCGVDTIFDKYDLKEGNDLYTFMERSVNDTSVTNVLILLDPNYAEKANNRLGGVGTETQIISSEVYNKADQTKFLPIVFKRNENGKVDKPTYLNGILHFDLSDDLNYTEEFKRLVRTLFGIEAFKKPELGNKPSWVEEDLPELKAKSNASLYKQIISISNVTDRLTRFKFEINQLKERLFKHTFKNNKEIIAMYDSLLDLRNEIISVFSVLPYVKDGAKWVGKFFDNVYEEYSPNTSNIENKMKLTLLHELFIYLISICYKNDLYEEIGKLFKKTYYPTYYNGELESFVALRINNKYLNSALNARDNKKYEWGTAKYWMDNIDIDFINKKEFIFADLLCFNASIFINYNSNNMYSDFWFPITYIYMDEYNDKEFEKFSRKLESANKLNDASIIFGFSNTTEFKNRFKEILESNNKKYLDIRYLSVFESPQTIFQFITYDKLGQKN